MRLMQFIAMGYVSIALGVVAPSSEARPAKEIVGETYKYAAAEGPIVEVYLADIGDIDQDGHSDYAASTFESNLGAYSIKVMDGILYYRRNGDEHWTPFSLREDAIPEDSCDTEESRVSLAPNPFSEDGKVTLASVAGHMASTCDSSEAPKFANHHPLNPRVTFMADPVEGFILKGECCGVTVASEPLPIGGFYILSGKDLSIIVSLSKDQAGSLFPGHIRHQQLGLLALTPIGDMDGDGVSDFMVSFAQSGFNGRHFVVAIPAIALALAFLAIALIAFINLERNWDRRDFSRTLKLLGRMFPRRLREECWKDASNDLCLDFAERYNYKNLRQRRWANFWLAVHLPLEMLRCYWAGATGPLKELIADGVRFWRSG